MNLFKGMVIVLRGDLRVNRMEYFASLFTNALQLRLSLQFFTGSYAPAEDCAYTLIGLRVIYA